MTAQGFKVTALLSVLSFVAVAASAAAETPHIEGEPWCDTLAPGAAAAVDCALTVGDVLLGFDYEGDALSAELTLTQTTLDGDLLHTSEPIRVDGLLIPPALRDINSDGAPELFIPTMSGNVNSEFLVWQSDPGGVYHPSGTISGFGVDAFDVEGDLVRTLTRENAATFTEASYILEADGFVEVYTLSIDYADQTCSFIDQGGVADAGLDPAAILQTCQDREWD
ncbi:hypothetical protein [Flavimaricola marinus]|uniref:FG-GAP repeat protein n=1 Tax=Flavimaricola marinus TaxID=1819565 RepID=A0A238LAD2_9RHOB|nr:hypothetical protein [Flavimaricola marinus]SMY06542.1 hypothetical protein LOM8899_00669 [Flavimaricola marinus]